LCYSRTCLKSASANDSIRLPETLSEDVLAKMHAPPKDTSIKTLEDPKELESFDAFLFGIPTRYGNNPTQVRNLRSVFEPDY
jgi:NAD(P)H dehydrogenase (quinone)